MQQKQIRIGPTTTGQTRHSQACPSSTKVTLASTEKSSQKTIFMERQLITCPCPHRSAPAGGVRRRVLPPGSRRRFQLFSRASQLTSCHLATALRTPTLPALLASFTADIMPLGNGAPHARRFQHFSRASQLTSCLLATALRTPTLPALLASFTADIMPLGNGAPHADASSTSRELHS